MGGSVDDALPFRHSSIGVSCVVGDLEGAVDKGCGKCRVRIALGAPH